MYCEYPVCGTIFCLGVIGQILLGLLHTSHNLMQFYSQRIYNNDINNFI